MNTTDTLIPVGSRWRDRSGEGYRLEVTGVPEPSGDRLEVPVRLWGPKRPDSDPGQPSRCGVLLILIAYVRICP